MVKLKNLNPSAGLRQVSSGYIYVPRKFILEAFRSKRLTLSELGGFFIFVLSTDWDPSQYRSGHIRFTQTDLADIWLLSPPTICRVKDKLIAKDLLIKSLGTVKVKNYRELFTLTGAKELAKNRRSNEEIEAIFLNPQQQSSQSQPKIADKQFLQTENQSLFKSSFKNEFIRLKGFKPSLGAPGDRKYIKPHQVLTPELQDALTPEEKEWITENVKEEDHG